MINDRFGALLSSFTVRKTVIHDCSMIHFEIMEDPCFVYIVEVCARDILSYH